MDYYYTCFGWRDFHPRSLHVTHKWLGNQPDENVSQIIDLCVDHFTTQKVRMLPILFNTVDYFGPKYERVLKCKTEAKSYFCLDLRAKLDAFKEDNFQWWQPHVTTDKVSISARITTYFIMKNKETLKQFELY